MSLCQLVEMLVAGAPAYCLVQCTFGSLLYQMFCCRELQGRWQQHGFLYNSNTIEGFKTFDRPAALVKVRHLAFQPPHGA